MGASQGIEITGNILNCETLERRDGFGRMSVTPVEGLIDQDLSITEEKRCRINKAISELSLTVCYSKGTRYRQAESGSSSFHEDLCFKYVDDSRLGRVREPRVILLLGALLRQRLPEAAPGASAL